MWPSCNFTNNINRFNRWSKNGTWAWRSFKGLRAVMTGATMARRFICAWWTPRRCAFTSTVPGRPGTTSLRKSGRGGRTTKIHLGENERVKTVFLTPGQAADCAQALLADLGRDGGRRQGLRHRRHLIETAGATAVIPSKSNRTSPRPLDREIYRMRNLVERFFGKIKEFRRVATRYDKELPLRRATGCQPILAPQNRKPII